VKPTQHPCGVYVAGIVLARAACGCCYDVTGRLASRALSRAGFVARPCPKTGRYGHDRAAIRAAIEGGATFEVS
jgi:hypothetical protein